jgi:prepilin peptidase CpaA
LSPIELGFEGALALGCLYAAASDIVRRRIPNLVSLALLLVGLIFVIAFGEPLAWPWHLLFAALSLSCGVVLYRFAWFGAGDAKFLAAVSVWFPLSEAPRLLIAIALSGLGLFVLWFSYRRVRGLRISRTSDSPFEQLPYGVAIAAGTLIAAFAP